jgi:hypothetical protein
LHRRNLAQHIVRGAGTGLACAASRRAMSSATTKGTIMIIRLHTYALLSSALLAGSLFAQSAPIASAQNPGTSTPNPAAKPSVPARDAEAHVASLNELVNADVVLPSDEASATPATKHAPRQIGRVKDLVFATRSGDIEWAVLTVSGSLAGGSKTILVPASSLKCTTLDQKLCYELRETEAALKGLPEFDLERAKKQGLDRALPRVDPAPAQAAADPIGAKPEAPPATKTDASQAANAADKSAAAGAPAFPPRFTLASELKSCGLNAVDKEFGKVEDAGVDARAQRVAYVLIRHPNLHGGGDSALLMPYTAFGWAHVANKLVLTSSKTVQQLSLAPEYRKPEQTFVTPDQLRRADEFFGRPATAAGM